MGTQKTKIIINFNSLLFLRVNVFLNFIIGKF